MAKMLGVWIEVTNPNRPLSDDLNLLVGGTIRLTAAEMARLSPDRLFNIRVKVMDSDTFSDDLIHTDETFSIAAQDTTQPFVTSVLVPAGKLRNSEPGSERNAEVYCRVAGRNGNIVTNASNSQEVNVRIH